MTDNANAAEAPVWGEAAVTLLFPLTLEGGAVLSTITLREPDAEMLEAIEALDIGDGNSLKMAQTRQIIALLSGVNAEALKKLNIRDITRVSEALGPLLEGVVGDAKT